MQRIRCDEQRHDFGGVVSRSLFGRLQPLNFSSYTTPDNDVERTRDHKDQGSWNRRHNHQSNTVLYAATTNVIQGHQRRHLFICKC